LARRLPKRGFTNYMRKEYAVVNLEQLNRFENGTEVTVELLQNCGIVKDLKSGVKVLGDGELEKKLVVKANKFSKSAVAMIEKAGGKAEVI
ncbi:MAG TPA: 50S ribosomal protein L15, partial [Erysipelotrichaceae bacterium]|nr:50S ribosomal protein L15 [Erysipelotrichaceae bacterium]